MAAPLANSQGSRANLPLLKINLYANAWEFIRCANREILIGWRSCFLLKVKRFLGKEDGYEADGSGYKMKEPLHI
jgi:hypothetical protein